MQEQEYRVDTRKQASSLDDLKVLLYEQEDTLVKLGSAQRQQQGREGQ